MNCDNFESFFDEDETNLNCKKSFWETQVNNFKYALEKKQTLKELVIYRESKDKIGKKKKLFFFTTNGIYMNSDLNCKLVINSYYVDKFSGFVGMRAQFDDQKKIIILTKNQQKIKLLMHSEKYHDDFKYLVTFLRKNCILQNFHKDYSVINCLASGSYSKVYKVKRESEVLAVKAFNKQYLLKKVENAKKSLINEIQVLKQLDHEQIIKFYEIHETINSIYLITEYIKGGSLLQTIRQNYKQSLSFDEQQIRIFLKNSAEQLEYLSSKNIIHRDIKPDNIMLRTDNDITTSVIVDFGLGQIIGKEKIFTRCGSPGYIAPEVIFYNETNDYDCKIDIYSLGCVVYEIATGQKLFAGECSKEILNKNKKNDTEQALQFLKQRFDYSKELTSLLKQMLHSNPQQRISASKLLESQFVLNQDVESDEFYIMKNQCAKVGIQDQVDINRINHTLINQQNNHDLTFFDSNNNSFTSPNKNSCDHKNLPNISAINSNNSQSNSQSTNSQSNSRNSCQSDNDQTSENPKQSPIKLTLRQRAMQARIKQISNFPEIS